MKKNKKRIGIRTKLIGTIIPIVLIMIITFFALSRNVIIQLSTEKLESNSQVYAGEISSWTTQIFSELQLYKDTIENAGFKNDKEILAYMETSVEKHEAYPYGLYMGDDKGVYLDGAGWVPGDDWVLTERDWYIDGVDNEVLAFGEPYYDSQTGDVCVSACVRMNYKKAARVLAVDVYLDYLSELVTKMDQDNLDIAFFVTKDSQTILAHPDTEMIAVTLNSSDIDSLYTNISKAMTEGKIGQAVPVQGAQGQYYVNINEIDNTQWYLVTGMAKSAVLADLTSLEIIMVAVAVIAATILVLLCITLMNGIVKPVQKVTNVLSSVAEGDFTQKIEVKGHDEIAGMSKNMQYFLEKMRGTLLDISGIAGRMNSQSEENESVSKILKESSVHQSQSVDVLNSMVAELSKEADRVASAMAQLTGSITNANDVSSEATAMMNQTVAASENGKQAMERVSTGITNIQQTIQNLSGQIKKADEVTAKIGDMVNMIKDIADETNLLSLNASIEAARAGQAGRGFAVVAEQISSLAESSKNTADNIERLTAEISETMASASKQMELSVTEVADSATVVRETSQVFGTVFDKVAKTNTSTTHMVDIIGEIDSVANNMQEIAAAQLSAIKQIEESARELEQCTRTVDSNSNTVADNALKLGMESDNLTERIKQFTV